MENGEIVNLNKLVDNVKNRCLDWYKNHSTDEYADITDINKWPVPTYTRQDTEATPTYGTTSNKCVPWESSKEEVIENLTKYAYSFKESCKRNKYLITAADLKEFILSCFWEVDRLDCQSYSYYNTYDDTVKTTVYAYGINNRHESDFSKFRTKHQSKLSNINTGKIISASVLSNSIDDLYNQLTIGDISHGDANQKLSVTFPQWGTVVVGRGDNESHQRHAWHVFDDYQAKGYTPMSYGGHGYLDALRTSYNQTYGSSNEYYGAKYVCRYRFGDEDSGNAVFITNDHYIYLLAPA